MAELNQDDLDRVRRTWAAATMNSDHVAQVFYATLFRIDPSTKPLFVGDINMQARKLAQTLTFIVDHLDQQDTLMPAAVALATRHVGYGVSAPQYDSVGQALITTLSQVLGPDFTPEDAEAWKTVYTALKDAMVEAAYPA